MAENEIKVRLQSAYKTESEWTASNPILKEGEVGYVADSNVPNYGRYKIGDGATTWKNLPWGDQNIQEKFDDLEIGGRNYLFTNRCSTVTYNGITFTPKEDGGIMISGTNETQSGYGTAYSFPTGVMNDNEYYSLFAGTYTLSLSGSEYYMNMVTDSSKFYYRLRRDTLYGSSIPYTFNGTSIVFTLNEDVEKVYIGFGFYSNTEIVDGTVYLKLEKGNKATDWTPAPEDKADVSHTHPASDITSGTLSSDRLSTIPVSKGGTGLTSLTSGQALIGNGTGAITTRAIDTTSGGTSGSTSLITSGAVYAGLSGKANSSHSHSYLPLSGGTLSGNLYFSNSNGAIAWNSDTYQQRILTTDDSTSDTAVFSFQQSSNSGNSFTDLMVIRDNGKVIANTFVGALSGNAATATTATKASQDASGNTITSSYAASLSVSGRTLTLKSKSGATLSTVTTQDTTYSAVTRSSNGLMIASDKVKLDGLIPLTDAEIDEIFNEATSGVEELDSIYPIGSVYISINHTNPGTIFGGTWERFGNGKVLVGVDENDTDFSTAEQSGGEKEHVLTTAEMPSHSHTRGTLSADSVGGHTHSVSATAANNGDHYHHMNQIWSSGAGGSNAYVLSSGRSAGWRNTGNAGTHGHSVSGTAQSAGGHSHTISGASDSTGNGKSHNNLQPYITVYMWLRTA